jgi:hypothetical protein
MFQRIGGYQKPDLYQLRSGGVWDAYIRMEGLKEFYEVVKGKIEIRMPLRKQGYGDWEFEVKGPEWLHSGVQRTDRLASAIGFPNGTHVFEFRLFF